jgi:aminoglycoside phosphotransferase (APT) family kinase protein
MERWSRRIGKLGEPFAGKAARLFGQLEAAASKLAGMEMAAGHGSYGPSQIILGPGRTVTFDWDGYDVAHPGRDVARFMIALRRLALGRLRSIRVLDAEAELFLKTYLEASHADAVTDLPFYQAATCLQLAKYNFSHQVSHWKEKIEAMLDEGLRIACSACFSCYRKEELNGNSGNIA